MSNIDKVLSLLKKLQEALTGRAYSTSYESKVWRQVIPTLISKLCKAITERDIIQVALLLKLLIEYFSQVKYFIDRFSHDDDKFMLDLRRRSRRGQSFSIRMITESKNVPGPVKKKLVNLYLEVSKFVHPSEELTVALTSERREDLFWEIISSVDSIVDLLLYLYMSVYGVSESVCKLCLEYSLERCLKRCVRS